MATEAERQVAGMKCPWDCEDGYLPSNENGPGIDCSNCEATGLRWPPLSRECTWPHNLEGSLECRGCGLTIGDPPGRVPDCTLEKVLDLLLAGNKAVIFTKGFNAITYVTCNGDDGHTPKDAAIAALLATIDRED